MPEFYVLVPMRGGRLLNPPVVGPFVSRGEAREYRHLIARPGVRYEIWRGEQPVLNPAQLQERVRRAGGLEQCS